MWLLQTHRLKVNFYVPYCLLLLETSKCYENAHKLKNEQAGEATFKEDVELTFPQRQSAIISPVAFRKILAQDESRSRTLALVAP